MPLAPPVIDRDPSCQLPARRSLCQLVALERPVFDRERLALREGAETADGICRVLDGDRTVVEIACLARAAGVPPGGDDADTRDEDDPGPCGVDRERTCLVVDVSLVVVAVPAGVLLDAAPECLAQLVGAARLQVGVHHERLVLRVDEVIGAGSADLAHLRRALGRSKRDRFRASVDLEDDAVGIGEQSTAERGKGSREEGNRALFPQLRDLGATQAETAARDATDCVGGSGDEFEGDSVAVIARPAPGDEPVPLQENRASRRIRLEEQRDPTGHVEAWPLIVEPDRLVAERLLGEPSAVGSRGQRDHGVRMRVIDVLGRDERVQQRLDRRPRLVGADRAPEQVVDHRRVVHSRRALVEATARPDGALRSRPARSWRDPCPIP